MENHFRVGTRTSPLALRQVEEVERALKKIYPSIDITIVGKTCHGDRDKITPITEIEGSDFFTKEIDAAVLGGDVDFAVHSAKDMPDIISDGLRVAAITKSIDGCDVLVSKKSLKLDELPLGAKIGTSSARRKSQLASYRPDFKIIDIRGNIGERLALLDDNAIRNTHHAGRELDAIVIAAAGLLRLGLGNRITQRIPLDILKPHPLQGSLALVTRIENVDLIEILSSCHCEEA